MPLINWCSTLVGYPEHRRSKSPSVGVSHMTTYSALRFAEGLGWYTGWIATDCEQPHMDGIPACTPTWVAVAELFADDRVARTEGMVGGTVIFVPAVPAHGEPAPGEDLIAWAEATGLSWCEIVDNEHAYWGAMDDTGLAGLLRWFMAAPPAQWSWHEQQLSPEDELFGQLRSGLFDHGWSRNGELLRPGRKPSLQLWGGVHGRCVLEHNDLHRLSMIQSGWKLQLQGDRWQGERITQLCPVDDDSGRVKPVLQ